MQKYPSVILHRNKTEAVRRFHPWVFSGAIKTIEKPLQNGEIVQVLDEKGALLGIGHYGVGSIAVRIFSFMPFNSLEELWVQKLQQAYNVRQAAGLTSNTETNAYRLLFGEGDGLPGIIMDWYNGTAVLQAHTPGMYRQKENFVNALQQVYGNNLKAVYDKSAASLHDAQKGQPSTDGYIYGNTSEQVVKENSHLFKVDWVQGQKTGFFIDQRENRALLARYAHNKKVLNTFCYTGGFSVYALQAGAAMVDSVDSSAKAMETAAENMKLNNFAESRYSLHTIDVFDFFKTADNDYDVIVLDPPAFAKSQSARHAAIKAYTRLNREALKKVKKGGVVFTFSCSQVVSPHLFEGAVTAAAIESGRNTRILHHMYQPADHPISIFNPEGLYLKGLVLYVE